MHSILVKYQFRFIVLPLLLISAFGTLLSQQPRKVKIAGVSVEGNQFADEQTIITLSGLRVGIG